MQVLLLVILVPERLFGLKQLVLHDHLLHDVYLLTADEENAQQKSKVVQCWCSLPKYYEEDKVR